MGIKRKYDEQRSLAEAAEQLRAARQDLYGAEMCVAKALSGEWSSYDLDNSYVLSHMLAAKWRIDAAKSQLAVVTGNE